MREVILRPEATRDIEDIADYTIDQWGADQARRYLTELRRAIEQLASTGGRYATNDKLSPGLRKMRSGQHLVYFLIDVATVDVVRVLHERMDVKARLR